MIETDATRAAALRELWVRGDLFHKLRPHQHKIYQYISNPDLVRVVVNCSRRFGKTFAVLLYCVERCIKKPGCVIRYAAPTEKSLRKITKPTMREILKDCPDDLKPVWNNQESCWEFPNGAELHVAGTDKDNAEKLRGQGADFVILDEAGSMQDLKYIANDILLPQTLETEGRMIVISTPPITPAHDFYYMAMEAKLDDSYLVQTVNENTHISEKLKQRYIRASGGVNSTTWRREWLCEFVVDEKRAVLPEFDLATEALLVREWERPMYFLPLVSLDVGYKDPTFILYGYYDFLQAKLILEDESYIVRARTDQIASACKETEYRLWMMRPVYSRKTDVDHRLIADMATEHALYFSPTAKDDKEAQVNQLRRWIQDGKIIINPKCKHLIHHLKTTIWNLQRTEFERNEEGHGDGVDALLYMLRNAPVSVNPFPAFDPSVTPYTHVIPPEVEVRRDENARVLEQCFGLTPWRN